MFSHYLPYGDAEEWRYWLPDERSRLPEAWPSAGKRHRAANGDEYEVRSRLVDFDPLEQRLTRQIRVALWHAGQLVAEEEHSLLGSHYFRNEVLLLLAQAGFRDVTIHEGYSGSAAERQRAMVVFVARK